MTRELFEEIIMCINYVGYGNQLATCEKELANAKNELDFVNNVLEKEEENEANKKTRELFILHKKDCENKVERLEYDINELNEKIREIENNIE